MTSEQFELIARYLRAKGVSKDGCRLVLVQGMRQCDAARALNIDPVLIAVSISKYRKMYSEILEKFHENNQ